MSRKLAHIEEIGWIKPIKDKDRIALAGVLGWTIIINKSDYAVGDKVVFCEIDSVLPEKPEFEFLRSKKFHIKTMKMAGVISQGICFPLTILPKGEYEIGEDVTDIIGIKQYEPTMDKEKEVPRKKSKNPLMRYKWFRNLVLKKDNSEFPNFIDKTDEVRIQNAPFYLDLNTQFIATEKVDGQSGSFTLQKIKGKHWWNKDKFDFAVCSRNKRREKDDSSFWSLAEKYNIEKVLHKLIGDNEWVAIQGECCGTGIQGNKYKIDGYELFVFNVIFPSGRLGSLEAKKIVEENGMKFVPIIDEKVELKGMTVNEVLDYATGQSKLANILREGIVFRTLDGTHSFKAVSPKFLLKNNE